jgi:hypothetical protein
MPILHVSLKRGEALHATRLTIGKQKLVYVLIADKRLKYKNGKSRIAYVGTTKKGVARIAQSVATRAEAILVLNGVHEFHARIITCNSRQRVKTWCKLERALILTFRERFGVIPYCNNKGKRMKQTDEFSYFTRSRIANIIDELS